jgi:hypothetical protein
MTNVNKFPFGGAHCSVALKIRETVIIDAGKRILKRI